MVKPIIYTREQEARVLRVVAGITKPLFVLRMARPKLGGQSPLSRGAQQSYAQAIIELDSVIQAEYGLIHPREDVTPCLDHEDGSWCGRLLGHDGPHSSVKVEYWE